jgi:hypothetical protein
MPSGRRSRSRSRPAKRARSASRRQTRRKRARRGIRGTANTITLDYHRFTRYGDAVTTTTTNVSEPLTYSWMLTDVLSYAEFTAMFDQYKILAVDFKIQMITNPDSTAEVNVNNVTNSVNWYPKFWYIRDYDGGGSDTLAQIKERVGVKFFVMRPNKIYNIRIKPKVLLQTYKTLTSTGYSPKACWIDCVDNNVPHYGMNAVIDCLGLNPSDATGFRFRVEPKFHLAFKGVR